MQVQIRLDIDTGNGNVATAGNAGTLPTAFAPLLAIALGGATIDSFHGLLASVVAGQLDTAISSIRQDYLALPEIQIARRPQVDAYLVGWRDLCRKHPNCVVSIVP
jgi:hypothetical protein